MSANDVADGFSQTTGKQWTQPIGFVHSLFEAAVDVLKRAKDPPDATASSIASINLQTIVGPIKYGQANVPPFAKANSQDFAGRRPMAAQGRQQIRDHHRRQPDLSVVPAGGKMEPIG